MSKIYPERTISDELSNAALDGDSEEMQRLIELAPLLNPLEESFGILFIQSAQNVKLFEAVVVNTNLTALSDEEKAGYLVGIINLANHEPSPQREAARILIDKVGFNPNNKANSGASNALSAAAEQGDVETTKMVLRCRNRIRGFEDDAVRDLIIFGIDRGLIDVRRDLVTPRGGEDVVPKLLGNEARMAELRRAKEAADLRTGGEGGKKPATTAKVFPGGAHSTQPKPPKDCCVIS